MKHCTICKKNKVLSEFNKNKSRKDGLQCHCRKCGQARSRKYYSKNKAYHIKQVYQRRLKCKAECQACVAQFLKDHPCITCNEKDIVVLEFDHVRCIKLAAVSTIVSANPILKLVQEEVAKCEVRCANCHRRKTARERNYAILKYT